MRSDNFLLAFIICCAFVLYLFAIEVIVRKKVLSPDISRRLAHISSGFFSLYMWYTFSLPIFLVCCSAFLLFICFSYYKHLLHSVHAVKRKTFGEICFPIGVLLALYLSWGRPEIFIPSILILTCADAAAGIVADLRQKQRPSKLGSLIFSAITVLILILYAQPIPAAFTIAYIVAVVEKISPYGIDNATIPIATTILLLL